MIRIQESRLVRGGGEHASRIVLARQDRPGPGGYSTHIEVVPDDRVPFLISGHYDMTLDEALSDYNERVEKAERLRTPVEGAR